MTYSTRAEAFNVDNVTSFRNIDVINGEVSVSEREYSDYLDELYGDVLVCGGHYGSGSLLQDCDPVAFRCGKGDYESELQHDLEEQLEREDESNIEFDVHPDEVEDEEE